MRRAVIASLLCVASLPCLLAADGRDRDYRWFDPIIELRSIIDSSYVEAPDSKAMQEAALTAMLRSLGDRYSVYVPPEDERSFNKLLRGNYVGIGAEIDMPDGRLRIVTPLDGSPAHDAGLMPGDIVLSIDGASTHEQSIDDCMTKLFGDPGTSVKVRVQHADGREEEVTIVRRVIQARTVKGFRRVTQDGQPAWEHMLDAEHGIAYVQLVQFTETTAHDLRVILDNLRESSLRGLIIDLRYDGGGALGAAIQIADFFMHTGPIVSVRAREGQERSWDASDDATDLDVPVVILVNEDSASASEILAGTLQDNGRAKVFGTRTFGKGSVQDVKQLGEGLGTVKITTARYYLPKRGNITRSMKPEDEGKPWGVDPDKGFHLMMDDAQARTMSIARRRWELPDGKPADPKSWADPAWVRADPGIDGATGVGDVQLAAALQALQTNLAGHGWQPVGDDPGELAAANDELRRFKVYRERLLRELDSTQEKIEELEVEAEEAAKRKRALEEDSK